MLTWGLKGMDEKYVAEVIAKLKLPCKDHGQKGNKGGYGVITNPTTKKKMFYHRSVYMQHYVIPPENMIGKVIMHLCDNPRCIEPTHLQMGTHWDNTQDMMKKGRHSSH